MTALDVSGERSLDGRTVVITGATGGIGFQTALALAKVGAELVITGRDATRGEAAVQAIEKATGCQVALVLGDLSEASGIDQVANEVKARLDRIDVLINNAGSLSTTPSRTSEGFDRDVAVNVVAPVRLTRALHPLLVRAAPARVINVTGGMPRSFLDVDRLRQGPRSVGLTWYSLTKRAMEAASLELAEELADEDVTVNIAYPGGASTAMTQAITPSNVPWVVRGLWPLFRWFMRPDGGKSAAKASRSSVWAATSPSLRATSGQYFDPRCRPTKFHPSVTDRANRQAVMQLVRGGDFRSAPVGAER